MKNRVIEVYPLQQLGILSVTVEDPDFTNLKINHEIRIGDKEYLLKSYVRGRGLRVHNTFTIPYTDDDLLGKQVIFDIDSE